MWSDKQGGCLHDECGNSAEVLGSIKGLSDSQIISSIRKGKSEINRYLILDKYIEFVKEKVQKIETNRPIYAHKVNSDKKLDALLRTSKIHHILKTYFRVSNFIMSHLCDKNLYLEYGSQLGIKAPNMVALLGIRELYQTKINRRMTKLKRPSSGKKPKSKKRTKGKRKQT